MYLGKLQNSIANGHCYEISSHVHSSLIMKCKNKKPFYVLYVPI